MSAIPIIARCRITRDRPGPVTSLRHSTTFHEHLCLPEGLQVTVIPRGDSYHRFPNRREAEGQKAAEAERRWATNTESRFGADSNLFGGLAGLLFKS